ncbi:isoleucine-tRNA ligase, mitochondrial-like protein [Sarcoptes scabiei]|uniref:isoleucine--tRNA ligase n=1 Tax=Sarcoptes scabiei TaxID=52283 RepID=A0A132A1R6_SARSC|nr:isoleucine-tRNA ligase, mitochondrial-like protein [Sarcoptes scabiei]
MLKWKQNFLLVNLNRQHRRVLIGLSKLSQYTQTLNLPKSNFPIKHSRRLELGLENAGIKFESLLKQSSMEKPIFVLHDGPPYANGNAHFGHAINRILKDIIVKRKLLENYNVDFRLGWDCHGLPIELKAIGNESSNLSAIEIRSKARQLATDSIAKQMNAFKKWFITADWTNSYRTYDLHYTLQELEAFYSMYKMGLIFRDRMPIYYSPSSGTALAEAELVYNPNHISLSIYFSYPLVMNDESQEINALIWTTTPWTLFANKSIAFSENLNYCLIKISSDERLFLIARENLSILKESFKNKELVVEKEFTENLSNLKYRDPITNQLRPFIASSIVTSSKASRYVIEKCLPSKSIILSENYQHNYPYDWRTNQPVIIIPSDQWFINIDSIREECLKALESVRFYPELHRKEMVNQITNRPNWCISRQRKYGVPIPVFFERKSNQTILNDQIFETLMNKFRSEGIDVWWKLDPIELLSANNQIDARDLIKGPDILDIWFDSGCSWLSVLNEPEKTSEIYLEGIDQLRGWFQSSLITSVALRRKAPYKSIFIHGFALDNEGHKMSKSLGNVIDPIEIIEERNDRHKEGHCGADGLRFWIARNACTHNDVCVDVKMFNENILPVLNRFRNTFRFMIGYLNRTKNAYELIPSDCFWKMRSLDRYLLYCLMNFHQQSQQKYSQYKFDDLTENTIHHVLFEISNFYLTRIKDRLYCNDVNSEDVRSIFTVLHYCYHTILYHMAPIIPHIVLECHQIVPFDIEEIIRYEPNLLFKTESEDFFRQCFKLIHSIVDELNQWTSTTGNSLSKFDCHFLVRNPESEAFKILKFLQEKSTSNLYSDLCECFQVARASFGSESLELDSNWLEISINQNSDTKQISNEFDAIRIYLRPTANHHCSRCRRFSIDKNSTQTLCDRCYDVE